MKKLAFQKLGSFVIILLVIAGLFFPLLTKQTSANSIAKQNSWSFSDPLQWEIVEGETGIEWARQNIRLKEQDSPKIIKTITPPAAHAGVYWIFDDKYILAAGNKECTYWVPYYAKLDLDGNVIFEKDYCDSPNLGYEPYFAIMLGYNNGIIRAVLDSEGNIYSPIRPAKTVDGSTNYDLGLCKFSPQGEKIWCSFMSSLDYAPAYGDVTDERAFDVALYEPDNAVYLFARGPGVGSASNFIIARYDMTSGARLWVNWYQRPGPDECWKGTVDNKGNPIGAGYFLGIDDTQNGILKLDKNGNVLWEASRNLKTLYGKNLNRLRGIKVDAQNNIIVAGHWGVWKYDENGNLIWEKLMDVDTTRMAIDHLANSYSFYGSITKVDSEGNLIWTYTPEGISFWSGDVGKSGLIITVSGSNYYFASQGYTERAILVTKEPIDYYKLNSFSADIPTYSFGNIYFQLSTDKQNWYWFDGANWTKTTGYNGNTAEDVNSNISKFSDLFHSPLYVKVILDSLGGDWPVEISSISVGYYTYTGENGLQILPQTGAVIKNWLVAVWHQLKNWFFFLLEQ